MRRGYGLEEGLRWGYAALGLLLVAALTLRLVREAAAAVRAAPRYRVRSLRVVWTPPPPWPDLEVRLRALVRRVRAAPLVEAAWARALARGAAALPWVARARVEVGRPGEVRLRLTYERAVGRLADGRLVSARGGLLPPLAGSGALPTVRAAAGPLTWGALRAAAAELARLEPALERLGLRGSFRALEVAARRRRNGRREYLLTLCLFRPEGGVCRIFWGRPTDSPRPADLPLRQRLAGLRRLLAARPGLAGVASATVAFWPPVFRPAASPGALAREGP